MPPMQAMAEAASGIFGASQIAKVNPEIFASSVSLADAMAELGIARTRYQKEYLASWPESQQEAIRATLYSAVRRGVPVTFAWAPSYDYEVSIWEASSTPESRRWITVFMRSRYPEDPLPEAVTGSKTTAKSAPTKRKAKSAPRTRRKR